MRSLSLKYRSDQNSPRKNCQKCQTTEVSNKSNSTKQCKLWKIFITGMCNVVAIINRSSPLVLSRSCWEGSNWSQWLFTPRYHEHLCLMCSIDTNALGEELLINNKMVLQPVFIRILLVLPEKNIKCYRSQASSKLRETSGSGRCFSTPVPLTLIQSKMSIRCMC